ncbi:MAG TPA: Tim44/TimA family putative adaptor protein [Stellaceae bacterium]|nr:Tim44/TimA family putative adaptor protein [Stellaceae bacterium]
MGGDGTQYLEIFVLAVIAGFLVLRLRSVLGRRTGTERRREAFGAPDAAPEKVVPLPPRSQVPTPSSADTAGVSGLAALKAADRSFEEKHFLEGARAAFEIIVNAFAKGDAAALKPLLSDAVFASFAQAIREREAHEERHETNLLTVKTVELAEGALQGDAALVTVKFVSDQINVTRAADGHVVDGSPDQVEEKTDLWTFSRSVRSRDPNWTLVATHSP